MGAVKALYGAAAARGVKLLYGGSTHAETAGGILSIKGIGGLLVGGASLNPREFSEIVKAAARLAGQKK